MFTTFQRIWIGLLAAPCAFLFGSDAYFFLSYVFPPFMNQMVILFWMGGAVMNMVLLEKTILKEKRYLKKITLTSLLIALCTVFCTIMFFSLGFFVTKFFVTNVKLVYYEVQQNEYEISNHIKTIDTLGNETKYRYDKTSQLINAMYNFKPQEIYNYDPNGNRNQAEFQDQKQVYETGEYNRLLSDENYRYAYDREGNRISKTSKKDNSKTKYSWDNRNRLVKIETPTKTIEYIYDYQNRLVKRTNNKNESIFVHDNWQIILQFDNKNLTPTHRYLWGPKQDELLCDNDNWTLGDHLNTIRDIVKPDGTVAEHLDYTSFGKLISVTKNTDSTYFAYTGKLTDKIIDLQWNINRWYDVISNDGRAMIR
jgi:YD repeat-containing protein